MIHIRFSSRLAIALAACTLAALSGAQTVTFRLKLPVGKKLVYVTDTKVDINMKLPKTAKGAPPMPSNMGMSMHQVSQVHVVSKSAKGYLVKTTIVDSKTTADKGNPMGAMVSGMDAQIKGSSTETVYDDLGNMVGATKFSGPSAGMMNQMGGMNDFNFGFMGLQCPKGPVSIGSKWSQTWDMGKLMAKGKMPAGMSIGGKMPVTYKLLKVANSGGKSAATIGITITGTMTFSGQGPNAPRMKMEAKLGGGGTLLVDLSTGIPQSSSITINMAMDAMGIPTTQKISSAMKLKK